MKDAVFNASFDATERKIDKIFKLFFSDDFVLALLEF
jgi:hypothetical protein